MQVAHGRAAVQSRPVGWSGRAKSPSSGLKDLCESLAGLHARAQLGSKDRTGILTYRGMMWVLLF